MDDQKTPPSENPVPTTPPPADPQAAAEEEAILNEVKKLETEEKNEVQTDAQVIDKREEAGKELVQEAQNLPLPATPAPTEAPTQPEAAVAPTTEPEPSTETS